MHCAVCSLELQVSVDVGYLCQTMSSEVLLHCAGVCCLSESVNYHITEILQGVCQFVICMDLVLHDASEHVQFCLSCSLVSLSFVEWVG